MNGPARVFIFSDGIRGHLNQSRGIALWLSRIAGAEVIELEVPRLDGARRTLALKIRAKNLVSKAPGSAGRWLEQAGGIHLAERVSAAAKGEKEDPSSFLCLSAGSTAGPYGLALARLLGGRAATVMSPSILGTAPFDYAIVPAHDFPPPAENVFVTMGAPNAIDTERLAVEAETLFSVYPPRSSNRWGILVGGDDANYRITPEWAREAVGKLADEAGKAGADLYLTTSRRTAPETEEALAGLVKSDSPFRMLFLASRDSSNPVPGILGGCGEIFCTEDSVSMVSEAATAGFRVRILRVGRRAGLKRRLQETTALLVRKGWLQRRRLWGAPRFDAMLEAFRSRGLATETLPWENGAKAAPGARHDFNEARDAAGWICREWDRKGECSS